MNDLDKVISKIRELKKKQQTILIAIDGFGGSGKSSLAKSIKEKFSDTAIVEMDDFYSPKLKGADYERVLNQIIKPLKEGKTADYQIYDWQSNRLILRKSILPRNIVIIEGVYSMKEPLLENYDIKIWVEYSPELGFKRGLERDKNQYGVDTTDKWLKDWMPRHK